MRSLFFSFLLSAGVALTAGNPASAAPVSGTAVSGAGQSGVLLVRDGCGRHRHFSKWQRVCVWNGSRGLAYRPYAPVYAPPVYGPPVYGYGYYGPPVYGPYGYGGFYRRW